MIVTTVDAESKRDHLDVLLRRGTLLVVVDGRACTGLPPEFAAAPNVVLRLGDGLAPPVVLDLGVMGFNATLSFAGEPRLVGVPWRAVYGMTSEASVRVDVQWPASFPQEDAPVREELITTAPRGKLRSV